MPQIETLEKFRAIITSTQDEVYEVTGRKLDPKFKKFMKEGDTSGPDYRSASVVGFGQHFQKPEVSPIRYDSMTPGRERITTWKQYALGWRVSDVLMRNAIKSRAGMKGQVKKLFNFTTRARKSADWTMEAIAAEAILRLDEATPTDLWVGAGSDGVAFASAVHPLIKGGNFTNLSASATFNSTALQDAITKLHAIPDETGMPQAPPSRMILVYGPALQWKVETVMGTQLVTGSNWNDVDPLNKYKTNIIPVMVEYLGPTFDGWALFDADNLPLEYYIGLAPTFTDQRDFETSTHLFKSEFEFSTDFHDNGRGGVYYPGT